MPRKTTKKPASENKLPRPRDNSETEEILRAIRLGEVDAFVINRKGEDQVWTLDGAHRSYLALLDLMKEGAVTLTPEGTVVYGGTRLSNMIKVPMEELIGRDFLDFIAADDRGRFHEFLHGAAGGLVSAEFDLISPADAIAVPVILRGREFEVHDAEKAVGIVIGDLREEKMLQKVRENEQRYRFAARAANEVIWEWNIPTGALHTGPALEEAFGWKEPVGTIEWWNQRIHPNDSDRILREIGGTVEGGEERWEGSYLFECADGTYAYVFNRAFVLRNAEGKAERLIGAMLDLSERHRHEQELKELNQHLEERVEESTRSMRLRSIQLRNLANEQTKAVRKERQRIAELLHNDVQQILVSILMRLETANQMANDEKLAKLLTTAYTLGQQAIGKTRLLTSELYPPILQHGTVNEIISWTIADMKHKHDLDVTLNARDEVPASPDEIKYILYETLRELLFNVVKHSLTHQASIELECKADLLSVSVCDRGKGCESAFNDLRNGQSNGGHFGLLSIRERIENYGGQLTVETSPGQGFKARMEIPYDCRAAVNPLEQSDPALGSSRRRVATADENGVLAVSVIIVDDHQLVREGIANILQAQPNIRIVGEASDGHEGIELARSANPDIVLMDINLPTMNGIQATRIIHEEFPETRIIGVSVNHDEATMRAMMDAGASAYIEKGSCARDLINTINRLSAEVAKPVN